MEFTGEQFCKLYGSAHSKNVRQFDCFERSLLEYKIAIASHFFFFFFEKPWIIQHMYIQMKQTGLLWTLKCKHSVDIIISNWVYANFSFQLGCAIQIYFPM